MKQAKGQRFKTWLLACFLTYVKKPGQNVPQIHFDLAN